MWLRTLPTLVSAGASSTIFFATCACAMMTGRPVVASISGVLGFWLLAYTLQAWVNKS